MSEPMLAVDSLSAWYGAARILYDLSFTVGRGEVVALDRKSTRLNSSHSDRSRMPSSA